jgi:hypothetical protein
VPHRGRAALLKQQRERLFDSIDSSIRPSEIPPADPKTFHSIDGPLRDVTDNGGGNVADCIDNQSLRR